MNADIKILAERLLRFHEKGFDYDSNIAFYTRNIETFANTIEAKFVQRDNQYTRIDKEYPIKRLVGEMGETKRDFAIKFVDSNEERFNDPSKIGDEI